MYTRPEGNFVDNRVDEDQFLSVGLICKAGSINFPGDIPCARLSSMDQPRAASSFSWMSLGSSVIGDALDNAFVMSR